MKNCTLSEFLGSFWTDWTFSVCLGSSSSHLLSYSPFLYFLVRHLFMSSVRIFLPLTSLTFQEVAFCQKLFVQTLWLSALPLDHCYIWNLQTADACNHANRVGKIFSQCNVPSRKSGKLLVVAGASAKIIWRNQSSPFNHFVDSHGICFCLVVLPCGLRECMQLLSLCFFK